AYRAMTLERAVGYAEAFYVIDLPRLHTLPFTAVQSEVGDARRAVEVQRESLPITVVIRTRDRPQLVREAVESVRMTQYPAKIVVVNDGGARPPVTDVELVEHQSSRGRSEAMNSGVRAAQTEYIAFLDDDDLFYPEHLETLARAAITRQRTAWYTDAVSAFLSVGSTGTYETSSRQRLFGGAFDRDLLLVDNYIPLPTLLVRRSDFLDLGGFDPAFDLLEDWDFLIRLSAKGDFLHVPAVTCEIRHFRDGDSAILQNPEGSDRFRAAKKQLWAKHSNIVNADVFANAFESQKRARHASEEELTELRGVRHHLQTDLSRLEREKQSLIAEIQSLHGSVTTHALRVRELEGGAAAMSEAIRKLEADLIEGVELRRQHAEMKRSVEETQTTIAALYGEIHRLQGLLDMIYRSRTWKLHTVVERMRGHR
ncbi:MAG TPA: glycosyltransferase, partial [Thermoanaerobaculia bacterium]|nr:glycosyltransferase [Thermoanaerobaculia bacterium]